MRRKLIRKSRAIIRAFSDAWKWKLAGGNIDVLNLVTDEFSASAGVMSGHYFHQDLLVARLIHESSPQRHVDIGSRIDGFVAHVASFREIEILDIRPIPRQNAHPNIIFTQADLMNDVDVGTVDSISCLHALEHFGLGRYGDPIDPKGHERGLNNIVDALSVGGRLYVSFPISNKARVEFNAHRVFEPTWILSAQACVRHLRLLRFDMVDDIGDLHVNVDPEFAMKTSLHYGCGIYTFEKVR